jgi:hypothetical protein
MEQAIRIPGGIIHLIGEAYTVTDRNGKQWRFTYHTYLGPTVEDASGMALEPPPEKSPFWPTFAEWFKEKQAEIQAGLQSSDKLIPLKIKSRRRR